MLTRVKPACDPETELAVERAIGCAITVHKILGPGYAEGVYHDAFGLELDHHGISFERERPVPILYRGHVLKTHRLDIVIEGRVLVELKAVERLERIHHAQVVGYLRSSGLRVGLLMNFNSVLLKSAMRRIVV